MPQPRLPRKKWSNRAWSQLRSFTKKDMIRLLDKDPRWTRVEGHRGAEYVYHNPAVPAPFSFLNIHYHPGDATYRNPGLLRMVLDNICWTEESLRQMKAID